MTCPRRGIVVLLGDCLRLSTAVLRLVTRHIITKLRKCAYAHLCFFAFDELQEKAGLALPYLIIGWPLMHKFKAAIRPDFKPAPFQFHFILPRPWRVVPPRLAAYQTGLLYLLTHPRIA